MEVPVELLPGDVDKDRIFALGKLIHALRPKRNGKADEQDCFDQHDSEFEMGRDAALHTNMVRDRMAAAAKTDEHVNNKSGPANEKRRHEPVRELQNVVDLVTVLGSVWRLTEKLVDESEATHTSPDLPPRVPDAARAGCGPEA